MVVVVLVVVKRKGEGKKKKIPRKSNPAIFGRRDSPRYSDSSVYQADGRQSEIETGEKLEYQGRDCLAVCFMAYLP